MKIKKIIIEFERDENNPQEVKATLGGFKIKNKILTMTNIPYGTVLYSTKPFRDDCSKIQEIINSFDYNYCLLLGLGKNTDIVSNVFPIKSK